MELFVNDLSIHEQFRTIPAFLEAFGRLMALRNVARRHGGEIYCHRMLADARTGPGTTMRQALQGLDQDKLRAAMSWMTRGGPFWEDLREHGVDDYLECRGDIVTDTAVGEAAFRTLHGIECALVSVTPSDWNYSPVKAVWRREAEGGSDATADIENWRDDAALEKQLRNAPPRIRSWADLREISMNRFGRFGRLVFAADCFEPLDGLPFSRNAAQRFIVLLDILDKLAQAFDRDGRRTAQARKIYRDHFTGGEASFTDSSFTEKKGRFRKELMFVHPQRPETELFCTWHGKIRHMTLRLHYSWSGKANDPVFVVYAGPKITKR